MVSTATNIGRDRNNRGTFFLTCGHGHGASHGNMSLGETHYVYLFGARHRIVKIAVTDSQVRDLGIFFLWDRDIRSGATLTQVKANCFPIAESMPQIGDSAHRIGYPKNNRGNWRRVDGRFVSTRAAGVKYAFSKSAISGESGAPYFNADKEIVAINWGGGKNSALTSLDQIQSFLQESIGGIPICNKAVKTSPPNPKPKVHPVPSPGINKLLERIAALEAKVQALEAREPLKGEQGEQGEQGPQGDPGQTRTITVIIQDLAGEQLTAPVEVPPDKDTVRIPIERFKRKRQ